jgi:hypothetical protein
LALCATTFSQSGQKKGDKQDHVLAVNVGNHIPRKMTDKQKERIKIKIKKIRSTLAAEKRKYGGFDDSRGLRYLPTQLFVSIHDFAGGLRYLRWFNKNFPNDIGFPEFLFESTLILFKTGKLKEAEDYAIRTYFSNTFLLDTYFKRPLQVTDKIVSASFQQLEYVQNFIYSHDQDDFLEFSDWLNRFTQTDRFLKIKNEFDDIEKQLETEPVGPRRSMLVNRLHNLR